MTTRSTVTALSLTSSFLILAMQMARQDRLGAPYSPLSTATQSIACSWVSQVITPKLCGTPLSNGKVGGKTVFAQIDRSQAYSAYGNAVTNAQAIENLLGCDMHASGSGDHIDALDPPNIFNNSRKHGAIEPSHQLAHPKQRAAGVTRNFHSRIQK